MGRRDGLCVTGGRGTRRRSSLSAALAPSRARGTVAGRQFHVEGFVNTCASAAAAEKGAPLVFKSEAIENIAPGWRARETYRFPSPDVLVEVFELAPPGKDLAVYTETRLERVRGP